MFVVGPFLNFRVLCVESSIWICMHLSYMVRKTNQGDRATIRSAIWTRKIFPFNRFFGWWSYPMGFIQVIICRFEILPEKKKNTSFSLKKTQDKNHIERLNYLSIWFRSILLRLSSSASGSCLLHFRKFIILFIFWNIRDIIILFII